MNTSVKSTTSHSGKAMPSTVVLMDNRLGSVLPVGAVPVLRTAAEIYVTATISPDIASTLGAKTSLASAELVRRASENAVVIIATSLDEPEVVALCAAGVNVLDTPAPTGTELLTAVALMDRLRSPGGCPWDAEQTHASLRQSLVDEAFELLEAIDGNDFVALREELGDVLLQVLFHARLAQEAENSFTIDDVATELVAKLVDRHPLVFANTDRAGYDAEKQAQSWEARKKEAKQRESSMDGVPLAQPAVNLAAKLARRATKAGLPVDLLPGWDIAPQGSGDITAALFALAASAQLAGVDPETELRMVARQFAVDVRSTEQAIRAAGIGPAELTPETWRKFWPS